MQYEIVIQQQQHTIASSVSNKLVSDIGDYLLKTLIRIVSVIELTKYREGTGS